MSSLLPTPTQIGVLPLRAIVAYAHRAARRVMLRYSLEHIETLQHELACLEEFVRLPAVPVDIAVRAAKGMASILGTSALRSVDTAEVILCFAKAADCCISAGTALRGSPADDSRCLATAARKAVEAARSMNEVETRRTVADYEILVGLFGSQEALVLGDAFDPTDSGPLGPL